MGFALTLSFSIIILTFAISFSSEILDIWRAKKYLREIDLSQIERKRLNIISYLNIRTELQLDFCVDETIRFYLSVFRELPADKQENKDFNEELMQYCIALMKDKYNFHPAFSGFRIPPVKTNLPTEYVELVRKKSEFIVPFNDKEENELFICDVRRWIREYEEIYRSFNANNHPDIFYEKMVRLCSLVKNISPEKIQDILHESYLFMAKHHRVISLKFYLHYLNVKSDSEKHKQIGTRNMSKLFDSKEQKAKFSAICERFQKDGNLEKALSDVDVLYKVVRRKISLNVSSIKDAKTKHANVAKLLGTYLEDDPVQETPVSIDVVKENVDNDNRNELFDLFIANAFRLNQQEVHIFAQSKGVFKDRFIESINEQYYETLDDLLIEEEGEEYVLNEEYYLKVESGKLKVEN